MKVKYNNKLVFNLPYEYSEKQRLKYVSSLLESYSKFFEFTENQDTPYDRNIHRVLNQFGYYLVTATKHNEDGKALRNDKEVMRVKKINNRRNTELPLFDSLAYSSRYNLRQEE